MVLKQCCITNKKMDCCIEMVTLTFDISVSRNDLDLTFSWVDNINSFM